MTSPAAKRVSHRAHLLVVRIFDGSRDRLPPVWMIASLPAIGLGLLQLASMGWPGLLLVAAACVLAIGLIVRASAWPDASSDQGSRRRQTAPATSTADQRSSEPDPS